MKPTDNADAAAFAASLALFDRPEGELHGRALPADTDVEAAIEAAFQRFLGNPSRLPL
jgi:hypothetical protein